MSLDQLRNRIDEIDLQLVKLLNERARVVVDIGKFKNKTASPVYAPDREKEVLARIVETNKGPLPDKCLAAIWRELMSGSFVLERPVIETLDALIDSNVKVCAEVLMEIHHNLMGNCTLQEIEKIYSKPEVFAQCRNWLSATFKDAQTIPVASTAKAAQLAAQEPGAAAIGSSIAAELYGLRIVCENIEDTANNVTRFLIISKEDARPTGEDKTAMLFSTAHKAGALADLMCSMYSSDTASI